MDNNEVLGHLLKVESEASTLVSEAQAEADKRTLEAEKQSHASYDVQYSSEAKRMEDEFQLLKEKVRQQYQTELEAFRQKTSSVHPDVARFSALLNKFIAEEAG
ncbi:MAG: hypothetical protein LBI06_05705 [Treponema sp.]|jgi:vacuolar-type H+-ATPase subunit H|nr:hypothetical protein [Treponema sp.]